VIDFPQFIYGEVINYGVCDDIIAWFEDNESLAIKGQCGRDEVQPLIKDSTDLTLYLNKNLLEDYWGQLDVVCANYINKYPWCEINHEHFRDLQFPNIQRYHPGQGFKQYHCEKTGIQQKCHGGHRHLVYMTYLNDVPDGGTHFLHQDFYCPAIKGLTIIWPPDWMFMHKGIISQTSTKYIATGWYDYYGEKS